MVYEKFLKMNEEQKQYYTWYMHNQDMSFYFYFFGMLISSIGITFTSFYASFLGILMAMTGIAVFYYQYYKMGKLLKDWGVN